MRRYPDHSTALTMARVRFVSPAMAAAVCGRSERTIRQWKREGVIDSEEWEGMVFVDLDGALRENAARARRRRLRSA